MWGSSAAWGSPSGLTREETVRRVLFRLRGWTVWSYPALLYLGLVAGVFIGNVSAHAARLDAFRVFVAQLLLIAAGLVGARLLHVASHWSRYRRDPRRVWDRREGGAAHYGGLGAALALSVPLLAALDVPLGAFWDATTPAMLATLIFARAGCLLNGCCAGRRAWGIPAQLLEAAWAAALLALSLALTGRLPFAGATFLVLAAIYATGRLPLLAARDAPPGAKRFTIHHGISVAMIVLSVGALTVHWLK
jgi:phosphatidylglycerol:prolipoprotein diacylglycerol transferase